MPFVLNHHDQTTRASCGFVRPAAKREAGQPAENGSHAATGPSTVSDLGISKTEAARCGRRSPWPQSTRAVVIDHAHGGLSASDDRKHGEEHDEYELLDVSP